MDTCRVPQSNRDQPIYRYGASTRSFESSFVHLSCRNLSVAERAPLAVFQAEQGSQAPE